MTIIVTLTNNSDQEYHYYASDFQIKNNSGQLLSPYESGGGAIVPKGKTHMTLNFQVENTQDTELFWQPSNHIDDLTHFWKLSI